MPRARLEEPAHEVPRPLGRDHDHVVPRPGVDLPEVDVEAVGEEQRRARLEIRRDLALVDALLHVVGEEDGDELGAAHRLGERLDRQAGLLGGRPGRAPFAQPDLDVDARVAQVERVGVTLAAVAEDGHLAGEEVEVAFAVDCLP